MVVWGEGGLCPSHMELLFSAEDNKLQAQFFVESAEIL